MDDSTINNRRLEQTADGSSTIYLPDIDEHYHSVKGAYTESIHIFLNCGLRHCKKSIITIFEVGFGTGLNAALTALNTDGRDISYYSVERYPLSESEAEAYGRTLSDTVMSSMLRAVNTAPWDTPTAITPRFTLHKINGDATATQPPKGIDVVYFDAFAPEKQPEMWTEDIFRRLYNAMNDGAVLSTYCAKGEVRRRLQSVGFTVERLPGPPGGKREILRATKHVSTR